MCNCHICHRATKIEEVIASRDPDKLIALIKELYSTLECAELDLEVYQAKLNRT